MLKSQYEMYFDEGVVMISVILAGGAGTRLWPVSRQGLPKPFIKVGKSTLLEQAIERGRACGSNETIIVSHKDHVWLIDQLFGREQNIQPWPTYIVEPVAKNTAPAVAMAAFEIIETHGADTVMLVLSADHLIPNTEAFVADALQAKERAKKGELVVFGIAPVSPEIGYGYIEIDSVDLAIQPVKKFVEKPSYEKALNFVGSGKHFWNSGIFCFTAGTYISALKKYAPDVYGACNDAFVARSNPHIGAKGEKILSLPEREFKKIPEISIDYAIMEKAEHVSLVPARFSWSDVGSWSSIADACTSDSNGNSLVAEEKIEWISLDTENTHLHVETQGSKRVIATVGVKNLIMVHTPDAILLSDRSQSQRVKEIVSVLKQKNEKNSLYDTTALPHTVRRPWGTYTSLKMEEPGYQVKKITVLPRQRLSLQYHHHRAEHWTVVKGTAVVEVDGEEFTIGEGGYKFIPLGSTHRLSNYGSEDLVLIEVQIGNYLGEDDIVRVEDIYGRN
ncbi:mannose-1-phosphate guanylyltransferase/mannose-6-phosphate isomerase [Alphaproteobacteria bacterium]|nr:mannose-1-phosphate guanylyltransferase/mannose-6-phosphate isomerase [Alphaproteobacteria bacterium]